MIVRDIQVNPDEAFRTLLYGKSRREDRFKQRYIEHVNRRVNKDGRFYKRVSDSFKNYQSEETKRRIRMARINENLNVSDTVIYKVPYEKIHLVKGAMRKIVMYQPDIIDRVRSQKINAFSDFKYDNDHFNPRDTEIYNEVYDGYDGEDNPNDHILFIDWGYERDNEFDDEEHVVIRDLWDILSTKLREGIDPITKENIPIE